MHNGVKKKRNFSEISRGENGSEKQGENDRLLWSNSAVNNKQETFLGTVCWE